MKVVMKHPSSEAILARAVKDYAKDEILNAFGGMSLEEVVLRLVEKDANPHQLPPGIGLAAQSVASALDRIRRVGAAGRGGSAKGVLSAVSEGKREAALERASSTGNSQSGRGAVASLANRHL